MKDVFNGKYRMSSIRLDGYDYGTDGAYFITICSYERKEFFCRIKEGRIILSPIGRIIQMEWFRTAELRDWITLDEFIIMPNHVHGIIFIHQDSKEPDHLPEKGCDLYFPENYHNEFGPQRRNLASTVGGFKGSVTRIAKQNGITTRIWQERYYEHIIRNRRELERIRMYIRDNPFQWELDDNHPLRQSA